MLTRTVLRRVATSSSSTGTAAAGAASAAVPTTTQSGASLKREVFLMRKSPFGLEGRKLHSHLLSDHVLTQRTKREESMYRQRILEERGKDDADLRAEAAQAKVEAEATPDAKRYSEIQWIYIVGFFGYVAGHVVAHKIFEGEETRLPYDPVNGFLGDLEEKKKRDELADAELRRHVFGLFKRSAVREEKKEVKLAF